MANLAAVFSDQEITNWLKSQLAINITKAGLQDFVDEEVQNFRTGILNTVASKFQLPSNTTCSSCCTANLLKCPTKGMCNKSKQNPICKMHDTPIKQYRPCPNKLCDNVRDAVMKSHRFTNLSWKNTSAEKWACNHWELAKCFMPPDGYSGVSCVQDTDFNGIVSVMLNCTHFDSKMSFKIASQQPSGACLLTKVNGSDNNSIEHIYRY